MARWITVLTPFDYRWPDRTAITAFTQTGEHMVKDEIADYATKKGYAIEGKIDATARSVKGGKGKRVRTRRRKGPSTAANAKPGSSMGNANTSRARRSADRATVADDAG